MMRRIITATASACLLLAHPAFAADAGSAPPHKADPAQAGAHEARPVKPAPEAGSAAARQAAGGKAQLHWYENGHRRALRIDPAWIADFASPAGGPTRDSSRTPLKRFIGGEKALEALPAGASPVFRDENGAARSLAGGVVVRLREADLRDARARLADAGLVPVRPIDPEGRSWLVESPPGLPSLELANQLHESGKFESVTPNWWRPRALK